MNSNNERIALVTGAASGLGLALTELLYEKGYKVIALDIASKAPDSISRLQDLIYLSCDVSKRRRWREIAEIILASHGVPDKLFLNAGVMTRPPAASIQDSIFSWIDKGGYEKVMRVNIDGVVFGIEAFSSAMQARGSGAIVITGSTASISGLPFDPFYSMSKHAVFGLVRSFATSLIANNVRINAFLPGGMRTNILPTDVVDSGTEVMDADDAARSLYAVSKFETSGQGWYRTNKDGALSLYEVPDISL